MKAVLALLLGLVSIAISDDSGEAFSWDSDDTDATSSYNGLVVQVYNPTDSKPVITLGTDLDDHENTYCLTLLRVFEATGYYLSLTTSTDDDFNEVEGSAVDLSDAGCDVTEKSDTAFSITCNDVNGGTLIFDFTFVINLDGGEGLEYTITLNDYEWVQDNAELVLVQSVKECSDTYAYSADSGEESEDTEDNDDDTSTDDDTTTRRRLLDDEDELDDNDDTSTDTDNDDTSTDTDTSTDDDTSDSVDEEDGISSDDSSEFDAGFTQFIVSGQAYDDCPASGGEKTAIDSSLVYDEEDEEVHIVFAHFDCNLFIDPYFGVDNSKLDSGVSGVYVMIASMIGLIGVLLF